MSFLLALFIPLLSLNIDLDKGFNEVFQKLVPDEVNTFVEEFIYLLKNNEIKSVKICVIRGLILCYADRISSGNIGFTAIQLQLL